MEGDGARAGGSEHSNLRFFWGEPMVAEQYGDGVTETEVRLVDADDKVLPYGSSGKAVWKAVDYKDKFRNQQGGTCYYTAHHGGHHQGLCAQGTSHAWKRATDNPIYMCGFSVCHLNSGNNPSYPSCRNTKMRIDEGTAMKYVGQLKKFKY